VTVGHLNLPPLRPRPRRRPLTPGEWTEAVVDLDDIAHAFPPGHRIAVSISTVYWPIAWPSPELATLTVELGQSAIELPVRPADPADARLRPFDPAEAALADPTTDLPVPDAVRRSVHRDLLSGAMTVDFPRWIYTTEMPAIGQTHRGTGHARYIITEGDPLSARCETSYRVQIERADGIFTHESDGTLTCDATHFIVQMRLRITENGAQVFARDWEERVPRDHM
jgi:uncharacterized protein